MKIANNYTLYINPLLNTASYGTTKFNRRISKATFGTIIDCTLSQLKQNVRILTGSGYIVGMRKH